MKNVNVSRIVLGWCFTFDAVYRMFDNHNALPVNIESRLTCENIVFGKYRKYFYDF